MFERLTKIGHQCSMPKNKAYLLTESLKDRAYLIALVLVGAF